MTADRDDRPITTKDSTGGHTPLCKVVSVNGEDEDVDDINIHDFTTFEQEQLIGAKFVRKRKAECPDESGDSAEYTVHHLPSFKSAVRAVLTSEAILEALKHYNHRSDTETEEDDDNECHHRLSDPDVFPVVCCTSENPRLPSFPPLSAEKPVGPVPDLKILPTSDCTSDNHGLPTILISTIAEMPEEGDETGERDAAVDSAYSPSICSSIEKSDDPVSDSEMPHSDGSAYENPPIFVASAAAEPAERSKKCTSCQDKTAEPDAAVDSTCSDSVPSSVERPGEPISPTSDSSVGVRPSAVQHSGTEAVSSDDVGGMDAVLQASEVLVDDNVASCETQDGADPAVCNVPTSKAGQMTGTKAAATVESQEIDSPRVPEVDTSKDTTQSKESDSSQPQEFAVTSYGNDTDDADKAKPDVLVVYSIASCKKQVVADIVASDVPTSETRDTTATKAAETAEIQTVLMKIGPARAPEVDTNEEMAPSTEVDSSQPPVVAMASSTNDADDAETSKPTDRLLTATADRDTAGCRCCVVQ